MRTFEITYTQHFDDQAEARHLDSNSSLDELDELLYGRFETEFNTRGLKDGEYAYYYEPEERMLRTCVIVIVKGEMLTLKTIYHEEIISGFDSFTIYVNREGNNDYRR